MMAAIIGFFAKSALMQSPIGGILGGIGRGIKAFFKALDWQGAIGLVVSLVLAWLAFHQWSEARHWRKQSDQYQRLYNNDQAAIAQLRQRAKMAETNLANIAQDERTKNAQVNRAINAHADALLLRGPGAARCGRVGDPVLSAGAGGHEPQAGAVNAGLGAVPGDQRADLIAVPFAELVARAKQCDADVAEDVSWRSADQRNRAEWGKLKAPLQPAK